MFARLAPLLPVLCIGILAVLLAAVAANADPVPTDAVRVSPGLSHFERHLNETESAWFRVEADQNFTWNISASASGAEGYIEWFYTDENESAVWRAGAHFVGGTTPTNLHYEWRQPFYNGTPYYLHFTFSPYATNASDGLNFSLTIGVFAVPEVAPGNPVSGDISILGTAHLEIEYVAVWARVTAAAGQVVEVNASLASATIAPPSGPAAAVYAYSYQRPYAGYDDFPPGWARYTAGFSRPPEYWAYTRLNISACVGLGCEATIRFLAPYSGAFFLRLEPWASPMQGRASLTVRVVAPTVESQRDSIENATSWGHRPFVVGRLLTGLDPFDWYSVDLNTASNLILSVRLDDPAKNGDGTIENLYEVALLTPDGKRAIAVRTNEIPGSINCLASITFAVSASQIPYNGTYLVKVTVLSTAPAPGTVDWVASSWASYNLSLGLSNSAPVQAAGPAIDGVEDEEATFSGLAFFKDPEDDPLTISVQAAPMGAVVSVNRSNVSLRPPLDFWGNLTLTLQATDWFGASAWAEVTVVVAPAPDSPRVNASLFPFVVGWNQGEPSPPTDLRLAVYDPDGDEVTLSVAPPSALTWVACGDRCLQFNGTTADVFGFFTAAVVASDPSGANVSFQLGLAIWHVNRPPFALDPSPPPIVVVASGASVLLPASAYCGDPDGDAVALWLSGVDTPFNPFIRTTVANASGWSDLEVAVIATQDVGSYALKMECRDPGGLTASFDLGAVVRWPNRRPVMGTAQPPLPRVSVAENDSVLFAAAFEDPDGDTLSFEWWVDGVRMDRLTGNTSLVTFNYTSAGNHQLSLRAQDPAGLSVWANWTVAVVNVDRPPTCSVSVGANLSGPVGQLVNVTAVAEDPDGDAMEYVWLANNSLISSSSSATAVRRAGTLILRLTVVSKALTGECSVTIEGIEAPPDGSSDGGGSSGAGGGFPLVATAGAAAAAIGIATIALRLKPLRKRRP